MKKSARLFKSILVLFIAISLIQCKKDDDTPEVINSVMMNENNFIVATANIIGVSIGDDGHTGITLISGSGTQTTTLTIDVESFTQATIEGDYAYPEESGKKILDDWLTNYTVYNGSTMESSSLESGEVSITNNGGNNYTIVMNLEMVDGINFNGTYTGEFQVLFSNQ